MTAGLPGHNLAALGPLISVDQWVVVRLDDQGNGKTTKIPVHFMTGQPCDAHHPANWTGYAAACAMAESWGLPASPGATGYSVGFVLTPAAGLVCIDIDGARTADGWSELAHQLPAELPGCMIEISQSGKGLHLWARHPAVPDHSCKRVDLGAEAYHQARFIAIGTQQTGTMADRCDALPGFLAQWFPPRPAGPVVTLTDGPCAAWCGPESDDELLAIAMRSGSASAVFGDGVTFADLWSANADKLARRWPSSTGDEFDRSSADLSLACRLAFFTGRDQARVDRMMNASQLVRAKWERDDYLPETIRRACVSTREVYSRGKPPPAAPPGPGSPAAGGAAGAESRTYSVISGIPLDAARALLDRRYSHPDGHRLKTWQGVFYEWDGAGWSALTVDDVRAMLYAFLDQEAYSTFNPNQSKVSNLLDALKAAAHLDSRQAPPCWIDRRDGPAPRELLACRNGLLHLPTRNLSAPTPAFFSTNATPYAYLPNAPSPVHWLAFLRQVWSEDQESIDTLQEIFGYLLTPDTSQQKLFLIIGPKRSGKGTIGRVLSRLLGEENVTSPSLSSLSGDFGLQPLVGKLAAIISDARIGGRADPKSIAENLLRLSGEDRVEINRKYLSSITLSLSVRFVMLTNELPRLADASGAMASRFIVLKMRESFYGKEDPGLTGRLLGELPGILNWAIEGWQRLQHRGHFVTPRSSQDEAQDLADLGSPVLAFVRDVCDLAPTAEADTPALHGAWRVWCAEQGIDRVTTRQQFSTDLSHSVGGLTQHQRSRDEGRGRFYRGIEIRKDWPGLSRLGPLSGSGLQRAG